MQLRLRDEGGYAIVLSALLLVALLLFAAFAVDLGAVHNARRQDQSAADVGALAGALELDTPANIVVEVKAVVHQTLERSFTDSEWDDPIKCPLPPSGFTPIAGARCIARDADVRLWVHIPDSKVTSTFGAVIGRDGYLHSAFAIAGYERDGFGGVLPFGLFGGGNVRCIKQGPANIKTSNPACDGTEDETAGNFGMLNFGWYGSSLIGTTPDCSLNASNRISNNIAIGVDHKVITYVPGVGERYDTDPGGGSTCPPKTPEPNSGYTLSGLSSEITADGLYSGSQNLPGNQGFRFSDGGLPRLQRSLAGEPAWMKSGGVHRTRTIATKELDDIPLHEFIGVGDVNGPVTGIPASCQYDQFSALTDVAAVNDQVARDYLLSIPNLGNRYEALWDRCLTHHSGSSWVIPNTEGGAGSTYEELPSCPAGCGGVIFGRDAVATEQNLFDIQYSPRFAYVPRIQIASGNPNEPPATTGTTPVRFVQFQPVFLQRLYDGCSAAPGSQCELEFAPGITYAGTSHGSAHTGVTGLTSIIIPPSALPGELGSDDAPFREDTFLFLRLLR